MKARFYTFIIILIVLAATAACAGVKDIVPDVDEGSAADNADCGGPTGSDQGAADDAGDGSESDETAPGADSDIAASATLLDLDGNSIVLSDFIGQVVVLNFWASWCPPCRQEMPELNELDKEFKESGDGVFISVNLTDGQRETRKTAQQYIDDNGFGFTVLIDDQGLLAYQYSIASIPQTFIFNRDGNVSGSIIGSTTKAAILEKVNAVK